MRRPFGGSERPGQAAPRLDLEREAVAEVRQVMAEGRANGVPYAALDLGDRLGLLSHGIDWTAYVNRGLDPVANDRLVFNATAGRPPDRWWNESAERVAYEFVFEQACEQSVLKIRLLLESLETRNVDRSVTGPVPDRGYEQER